MMFSIGFASFDSVCGLSNERQLNLDCRSLPCTNIPVEPPCPGFAMDRLFVEIYHGVLFLFLGAVVPGI